MSTKARPTTIRIRTTTTNRHTSKPIYRAIHTGVISHATHTTIPLAASPLKIQTPLHKTRHLLIVRLRLHMSISTHLLL
jgi:hypothetical protein